MKTSKKHSKKAGLTLVLLFGSMLLLSSCGGHKLCSAFGGKTTNSEVIKE